MNTLLRGILIVLLGTVSGCQENSTGIPSGPTRAIEANQSEAQPASPQNDATKKNTDLPKASDPLEQSARSLNAKQVRVLPTKSEPAGEKNERAEFEWAVLARVAASEMTLPDGFKFDGEPSSEIGWTVARMRVQFRFDRRYKGMSIDKDGNLSPKAGAKHIEMIVKFAANGEAPHLYSGTKSQDFGAPVGATPLTLNMRGWMGPTLDVPNSHSALGDTKSLLEVGDVKLDDIVQPILKTDMVLDASKELELLKVSGKSMILNVIR